MKKFGIVILAVLLALTLLVGCDNQGGDNSNTQDANTSLNGVGTAYADKQVGFQLDAPEKGEQIAILHTSMGDISVRLFPEAAPKAVKNFVTHAQEGYYDGLIFHRVVQNFVIQGGDPTGTGRGGESIWSTKFEDEFDTKLLNLTGALSMANSGVDTNGSQFFINQSSPTVFGVRGEYSPESVRAKYDATYENYVSMYQSAGMDFTTYYATKDDFFNANYNETYVYSWVPSEVWDLYEQYGGNLSLDGAWRRSGGHTVFGQVFDGMDVVEAIAAVEVDKNNGNRPLTDVVIESVEITTYGAPTTTRAATTTANTSDISDTSDVSEG